MCRRAEIETKVLSNIRLEDHGYETLCHVWCGSHSGTGRGGGYPRMSLDGQTVAVHIVTFTNVHGFVPGKKQIDHKCNNRMCVNPDHLQMVTHKKNQKLRAERARKKPNVTATVPAQLCELPRHEPALLDPRGEDLHGLARVLDHEAECFTEANDGRYPPDHAYW